MNKWLDLVNLIRCEDEQELINAINAHGSETEKAMIVDEDCFSFDHRKYPIAIIMNDEVCRVCFCCASNCDSCEGSVVYISHGLLSDAVLRSVRRKHVGAWLAK